MDERMSTETYTAAERVNKAVEVCKDRCSPYCPYWAEDECRTIILIDCAEAIAELEESKEALEKRNEPIKPELIMTTSAGVPMSHCPNCNEPINQYRHPKFCGACGQAVKWE